MNGNGTIDSGTDLVTSYTYNAANSKLTTTSPTGGVTAMAYDSLQRVTQITDALHNVTQFSYGANSGGNAFDSAGFKPTHTVDPRGFTTDVAYDALYRPVTKAVKYASNASPSTTSTRYDAVGNATLVTDPLGHQTSTAYDALNRPTLTTYADGSTTQQAYTSTGFKWQVIDPNGNQTRSAYDAAGRATSVTAGYGSSAAATTTTHYDAAGNVAETVNPLCNKWDYAYDARNRKVQEIEPAVVDATNNTSSRPMLEWQYDPAGRVTAVLDAYNHETDTHYDAANRVIEIDQPTVSAGTAKTYSTYDKNGNVLTLTDPNGQTTVNTYDLLNRLLTSTDAANITVTNTYDQVGNKLTVTDGNNHTTTFAYDGLSRNTAVTDAAGASTHLTYDAMNKTQRVDALGQVTTYLYDNRNRLQHVVYASSAAANSQRDYAYDSDGNLLSVTESSKTAANVAYTYDALNRAITETSGGLTHSYTYDLAGNRLSTVYGGTSRTITSTYDALNRLGSMSESGRTTLYAYDLNGNIAQKTAPNGDTEAYSYDALNRATIESAQTGGAVSLFNYQYAYDLFGNVTSIAETYPSGLDNRTVTNTYDNINRLSVEAVTGSAPNSTTTYNYDAANNCTSTVVVGGDDAGTTSYNYNNLNQMTATSNGTRTEALSFNVNGNCVSDVVAGSSDAGTDSYSYDFENRLIGMVKGTAGTGTGTYAYGYDYRTRRILRDESSAGGVTTAIVFSGGTSVQEYDGSATTPTVEYIRGSDYGGGVGGILYTLRSGTPSYTHENKRGDVVAKTDGTGSLTFQGQYNASGKVIASSGSTLDRQKSNSKDCDPWGGINDGQRISLIHGKIRIFLTRDPAGFVDGTNLYTYVVQNPWTAFDPEGLWESGDGWSGYAGDVGKGLYGMGVGAAKLVAAVPSVAALPVTGLYNSIKDAHAMFTDPQGMQHYQEQKSAQQKQALIGAWNGLVDKSHTAEGKGELFFDTFTALDAGAGVANLAKGAATLTKVATLPEKTAAATTSEGTGILHYYDLKSGPHFSVETIGEDTIHTHQVYDEQTMDTTMEHVETGDLPAPTKSMPFSLSNINAAQQMQLSKVDAELGTYNKLSNSCLTTSRDVLNAGGANLPTRNLQLGSWANKTFDLGNK